MTTATAPGKISSVLTMIPAWSLPRWGSVSTGKRKTMQWIAGVMSGIIAMWSSAPAYIQDGILVAVLFMFADTAAGASYAAMQGKLWSRKLFQGFFAKCVQYALLCVFFGGAAFMAHNWIVFNGAIGIIVGRESLSIIETIYLMEKVGGEKFPPWAKAMLERLGNSLAVGQDATLKGSVSRPTGGGDQSVSKDRQPMPTGTEPETEEQP